VKKLLQLASVRLRIILFGLTTAITSLAVGHKPGGAAGDAGGGTGARLTSPRWAGPVDGAGEALGSFSGFDSPQRRRQWWGVSAGLSLGGGGGKVVKGGSSGPYDGLKVPVGS
jgi:hypothetical protein